MKCFRGKAAYKDIALGKIYLFNRQQQDVKREQIEDADKEVYRFAQARLKASNQLQELYGKVQNESGKEIALIIQAQQVILLDEEYILAVEAKIKEDKVNAEYAVYKVGADLVQLFHQMEDEYTRERAVDIQDVTERMISCLCDRNEEINGLEEASIIVAEELSPSDTIRLDKNKVLAFVTRRGSVHSHVAILARTMNIPALVDVDMDLSELEMGMEALVDGDAEEFIIEPDEMQKQLAKEKTEEKRKEQKKLQKLIGKEDITLSGHRISLCANAGSMEDIEAATLNDAAGIGLLRSEFLYLGKDSQPDEEEQFAIYKKALESMNGKTVVIRTLDIGADKKPDYIELEKEENPAMGFRAIRVSLQEPEVLKTQLRALYRASVYGSLAIMYPMVISTEEVRAAQTISKEVRRELSKEGIPYKDVEEGIMIETPAAALISDELAELVDFFSIGTNDLTQYTLAIDRQNGRLESLYNPHHKAVLRMIQMVVENAHKAGIWVGICGELAADPKLTEWFVKIGMDELSVAPASILKLRQHIRELN